jgi:hypothetical protein
MRNTSTPMSLVSMTGTPTSVPASRPAATPGRNHAMTAQLHTEHLHDDDLLTITEAAAVLRTPVATLRYWRYLGTGPRSFRLGRRVLYRAGDLHRWIQEQHDAAER